MSDVPVDAVRPAGPPAAAPPGRDAVGPADGKDGAPDRPAGPRPGGDLGTATGNAAPPSNGDDRDGNHDVGDAFDHAFGDDAGLSEADAMDELRRLLVGPDHDQVKSLAQRLEDLRRRAEDISRVLPDAVRLRKLPDRKLGSALSPHLEEAFRSSITKNKDQIADVMAPVIGPAIRRAVTDALASMVQTLNTAIEHSLSPRSVRWRVEAWRTGIPFAEVVLRNTLRYKVEQVFLIHRETGLLLQHVVRGDEAAVKDADMVSAMLTAIRDFCRDSFGAKADVMDSFRMDPYSVWVRQGSKAILAVVIWGTPPEDLHTALDEAQEQVHGTFSDELDAFKGETEAFEKARPVLQGLLTQAIREDEQKRGKSPLLWLAAAAVVAGIGVWAFFSIRDARRWDAFLAAVKGQEGIVVTESGKRDGRYYVAGLRDPRSADPVPLFRQTTGWDPSHLDARWQTFYVPKWSGDRALAILAEGKPASATVEVRDGALVAAGEAPPEWIASARAVAAALPGIDRFDGSRLRAIEPKAPPPPPAPDTRPVVIVQQVKADPDDRARADGLAEAVRRTRLTFLRGTAQLEPGPAAEIGPLAQTIMDLMLTARRADLRPAVRIVGDATADEAAYDWVQLSRGRADVVKNALIENGVAPAWVETIGRSNDAAPASPPPAPPVPAPPTPRPATSPAAPAAPRPTGAVTFTVTFAPPSASPAGGPGGAAGEGVKVQP